MKGHQNRLQQALFRVFLWAALEILFSAVGIDNLVDYSEFLFEPRSTWVTVALVSPLA